MADPFRDSLSDELRRVSSEVMTMPGVVGVFWGHRRRGQDWSKERVLCVHVERKGAVRAVDEVPARMGRYATDVIEVGAPMCHGLLDTTDSAVTSGPFFRRTSSVSAVGVNTEGVFALLSGHGSLPALNGKIMRGGAWDVPGKRPRIEVSEPDGSVFAGEILRGAITPRSDSALVAFAGLDPERAFRGHLFSHGRVRVRLSPPKLGTNVKQYGTVRRATMTGFVRQVLSSNSIRLGMPDQTRSDYADVLLVSPNPFQGPFSVRGESGSLVLTDKNEAIGTIVGGSSDGSVSYVLGLGGVKSMLGKRFSVFFEEVV